MGTEQNMQPLTPEEMWRQLVQAGRGFESSPSGAGDRYRQQPATLNPGALDEGQRGAPLGKGYETFGAIQLIDANGNRVAVASEQFIGGGADQHAEARALRSLEASASKGVVGGRMIVVVDQDPCPSCQQKMRDFAQKYGIGLIEPHVPVREKMNQPGSMASPKTTSRSSTQGGRPAMTLKPLPVIRLTRTGGAGGNLSASQGSAWQGPGGTPGYDASRIQNAGAALQLFQNWASQLSAMNTYYAALNQIQDRESEIISLQNADPFGTVIVKVIFEIHNENLPAEMPRMYELISVEIGNESIARGDILGQNQHGYTIRIAALKRRANADQVRPDPKPGVNQSWQQRYDTFLGTLYTRSGNVQDPTASLVKLDNLALVDVLPILRKLKKEEHFAFDRLQQALDWPGGASVFNRSALVAAFMAVRAEENAVGAFQNYVSSCNDYGMLNGDQKATIKAFISGTLAVNTGVLRPQGLQGQWSAETGDVKFLINFGVPGDDLQGQPAKTGNIFWQETASAPRHWGEWSIAGTTLTFSFWDDPAGAKRTWTAALAITDGTFKSPVIEGSAAIGGKTMGGFKFTKVGAAPGP